MNDMTKTGKALAEALRLDVEIGRAVRLRRKAKGLSQTQLGDEIGVSFQQIQKYERGTNRISSSALILLSRVLDCAPGDILNDMALAKPGKSAPHANLIGELLDADHGVEAMRAFVSLPHEKQKVLLGVARAMRSEA